MKKKMALACLIVIASLTVLLTACAPQIPHAVAGRSDCISCHGPKGIKPFPGFHAKDGYTNAKCASCHQVAPGKDK